MSNIQLTELSRYHNNVTAHKIIKVDGSNITILLWGDETTFPIITDAFEVGNWIDLQIKESWTNGRVNDYSISYVGRTPERFIPKNN